MIEIKVSNGESIERALRRFKNKVDSTGLIDEVRRRRTFMTKGQYKKYKQKLLDKTIKASKNR